MCVNVSVYVCQCVYMHPGWSLEIFVGENVYTINKNRKQKPLIIDLEQTSSNYRMCIVNPMCLTY